MLPKISCRAASVPGHFISQCSTVCGFTSHLVQVGSTGWTTWQFLGQFLNLQEYSICQGIRVLADSQLLICRLSQSPACRSDFTCCSVWTTLSIVNTLHAVDVQWTPAHVDLEGNAAADQEANCRRTLMQSTVTMDYTTVCATLTLTLISDDQNDIADGRCHSDRVFTDSEHIHQHWQCDWTMDQCVTVAQLCTGGAPAHEQARSETWPGHRVSVRFVTQMQFPVED